MPDTGVNVSDGSCCGTWNYSQTAGFLLENTGNVNISVGYTCAGNCTHLLFIGGSRAPGMGGLEIKVTANVAARQSTESGAADSVASCVAGGTYYRDFGWNITNSTSYSVAGLGSYGVANYTSLSAAGHWLCGNFTHSPLVSDNSKDAAVVDINVTIPTTAPATGIESIFTLTFNGTSQ